MKILLLKNDDLQGAGAVSVILTMPQDVIKTRMQGEEVRK